MCTTVGLTNHINLSRLRARHISLPSIPCQQPQNTRFSQDGSLKKPRCYFQATWKNIEKPFIISFSSNINRCSTQSSVFTYVKALLTYTDAQHTFNILLNALQSKGTWHQHLWSAALFQEDKLNQYNLLTERLAGVADLKKALIPSSTGYNLTHNMYETQTKNISSSHLRPHGMVVKHAACTLLQPVITWWWQ